MAGRITEPRNLLRAMQWLAVLSHGEARAALRDYRAARDGLNCRSLMRWGGGEAVAHFGGPAELINRAARLPRALRNLYSGGNA